MEDRARNEQEQRSFVPPRCPFEDCPSNATDNFSCVRNGWHETERAPFRVQRFRCRCCKRTFSTQTFSYTYWQKRPQIDQQIFFALRSCSANRQIAIAVRCGKSTVAEKLKRMARHCIRFHVSKLRCGSRFEGDLIFDGLGTFEHSQYFPLWLNLAVHRDTSFMFGFTESPIRRSGMMRPAQKRKRERLEAVYGKRNGPNEIRRGTAELLSSIRPFLDDGTTRLLSDEHGAYRPAIRDAGLGHLPHLRVPGSAARTAANPLFEINLADMLLRHTQSSQKRETIAFNKRRQAGLERAWAMLIHRNYMGARRAKRPGPTPAMLAGITDRALTFEDIFTERIFPSSVQVPPPWQKQIRRDILTPQVGRNTLHELRYAT